MGTHRSFGRALKVAAASVLCVGLLAAVSPASTAATSIGPTTSWIYVYQDSNYGGSSRYFGGGIDYLTDYSGPCQNWAWESKTWNDCISSWKFTNSSGQTMSLTFYTDVNWKGSSASYYCLRSGYTWVLPSVPYNDQYSSFKWIVNNLKPGGTC